MKMTVALPVDETEQVIPYDKGLVVVSLSTSCSVLD